MMALFKKFIQQPVIFYLTAPSIFYYSHVVYLQAIVQNDKPTNSVFQPAER